MKGKLVQLIYVERNVVGLTDAGELIDIKGLRSAIYAEDVSMKVVYDPSPVEEDNQEDPAEAPELQEPQRINIAQAARPDAPEPASVEAPKPAAPKPRRSRAKTAAKK